jgi:phage baseplate assembly protein W
VKTINIPFKFEEGEVLSTASVDNIVKQQIVNYLMTVVGERVMNSAYGGNLQTLAFEMVDPLILTDYKTDVLDEINANLSFGKVLDISITETTDDVYFDNNAVTVVVRYAVSPRSISTLKLIVNETFTEESTL